MRACSRPASAPACAARVDELGEVGAAAEAVDQVELAGWSSGPRRWQRAQRTQRGNGATGTPTRDQGSSASRGSQGAERSARTCGPRTRCTSSSSRGSSIVSCRSGLQASMPRTMTLIPGRSTTAPTPAVVTRLLGRALPIRDGGVGAPRRVGRVTVALRRPRRRPTPARRRATGRCARAAAGSPVRPPGGCAVRSRGPRRRRLDLAGASHVGGELVPELPGGQRGAPVVPPVEAVLCHLPHSQCPRVVVQDPLCAGLDGVEQVLGGRPVQRDGVGCGVRQRRGRGVAQCGHEHRGQAPVECPITEGGGREPLDRIPNVAWS